MRHKLRSGLTLLGIILGAMSVSITLSIGEAIKNNNKKVLESKDTLKIINVNIDELSNSGKKNKDKLYMNDSSISKIKTIEGVDGVWANLSLPSEITVVAGNNNKYESDNIIGVLMDDIEKFKYKLKEGTLPTQQGLEDKSIQVLAGQFFEYSFRKKNIHDWRRSTRIYNSPEQKYSSEKYGYSDNFILKPPFFTYGKEKMSIAIRVDNSTKNNSDLETFDIITGQTTTYNEIDTKPKYHYFNLNVTGRMDWDSIKDTNNWRLQSQASYEIFIDISLAKELIKLHRKLNHVPIPEKDRDKPLFIYENVEIKAKDTSYVIPISDKLTKLGFKVKNSMEDVKKEESRTRSNQLVLAVLGAITLFVASLSVANTMITSMYERTTEIGVMKVIGCKVGNIQWIFLLESALLGVIGGTIGISITYLISNFMNNITNVADPSKLKGIAQLLSTYMQMMQYDKYTDVKMDIALIKPSLWIYIIIGSMLISTIAGYLPSRKASNISALAAIKDE